MTSDENRRCKEKKEEVCNEGELAEKVINMGIEARQRGVKDIFICTLYSIRSIFAGYTTRFNEILCSRCCDLGFNVIYNSNIELCDLSDGLHVDSKRGHNKLKHNIMQCFDTYIHNHVKSNI